MMYAANEMCLLELKEKAAQYKDDAHQWACAADGFCAELNSIAEALGIDDWNGGQIYEAVKRLIQHDDQMTQERDKLRKQNDELQSVLLSKV